MSESCGQSTLDTADLLEILNVSDQSFTLFKEELTILKEEGELDVILDGFRTVEHFAGRGFRYRAWLDGTKPIHAFFKKNNSLGWYKKNGEESRTTAMIFVAILVEKLLKINQLEGEEDYIKILAAGMIHAVKSCDKRFRSSHQKQWEHICDVLFPPEHWEEKTNFSKYVLDCTGPYFSLSLSNGEHFERHVEVKCPNHSERSSWRNPWAMCSYNSRHADECLSLFLNSDVLESVRKLGMTKHTKSKKRKKNTDEHGITPISATSAITDHPKITYTKTPSVAPTEEKTNVRGGYKKDSPTTFSNPCAQCQKGGCKHTCIECHKVWYCNLACMWAHHKKHAEKCKLLCLKNE